MEAQEVRLNEFKCWDCDQIFLVPLAGQVKFCPRCESQSIQHGGIVTVLVKESDLQTPE